MHFSVYSGYYMVHKSRLVIFGIVSQLTVYLWSLKMLFLFFAPSSTLYFSLNTCFSDNFMFCLAVTPIQCSLLSSMQVFFVLFLFFWICFVWGGWVTERRGKDLLAGLIRRQEAPLSCISAAAWAVLLPSQAASREVDMKWCRRDSSQHL